MDPDARPQLAPSRLRRVAPLIVTIAVVILAVPFVLAVRDLSPEGALSVAALYAMGAVALVVALVWALERSSRSRREETAQRALYQRLLTALSDLGEGVVMLEAGRIVFANSAFCALSGYTQDELKALLTTEELMAQDTERQAYLEMRELQPGVDEAGRIEVNLRTKAGASIPVEFSTKSFGENERNQRVVVVRDIRLRREYENLMARTAATDPLTDLGNRRSAEGQLAMVSASARRRESDFAVAMIDLDHFKDINDTYGHEAGDSVLTEFAKRLKEQLRLEDFAGRWGGEEFIVILPHTGADDAAHACERIRSAIADLPFSAGEQLITVTASIGVATGTDGALLISQADAALYVAKREGRNQVR